MKKLHIIILGFLLTFILGSTSHALEYSDDWYIYNGTSTNHKFTLRFPTNWGIRTEGNHYQSFGPLNGSTYFYIQEFEGQTYQQVLNYFKNDKTQLIDVREAIIISHGEDLVTKQVTYKNLELEKLYSLTLLKRGNTIFAISNPNLEGAKDYPVPTAHNNVVEAIFNSFQFKDGWSQYIDYKDKYSFIYPSDMDLVTLNNRVEVITSSNNNKSLFTVNKYPNVSLTDVPELAEGYGEQLESTKTINFHGIENAITATYVDIEAGKKLSRIFIERNGNTYSLSNTNIEENFPHSDYYDEYLTEIIESYEFFDVDNGYSPYQYFPDVRDNHSNSTAINHLKQQEIIGGYADGSFKPDGEISKAELVKFVVATSVNPDKDNYNHCFDDVEDQWHAPYICYAKSQGWVSGVEDNKFEPNAIISRVEALKIIFKAIFDQNIDINIKMTNNSFIDIDYDSWYSHYFIFGINYDLLDLNHTQSNVDGYISYFPEENITRKEVAETIFRSMTFEKYFLNMDFGFYNF